MTTLYRDPLDKSQITNLTLVEEYAPAMRLQAVDALSP